MFDTTRLRVFREVVERGSFSAAAEALSFTQPAVSRQIATLEREAGAQLLQRMPRGIRLTEAGRVLLGHTEAILGRMAAAQTQIDAVARLEAGRLRIGSFSTANATVVLPMAAWAEETGTYTNYSGRIQIANRAVAPAGESLPLHTMMSQLLGFSGTQVSPDPAAIFDWMARETAAYSRMTYASIGPLGLETIKETVQ